MLLKSDHNAWVDEIRSPHPLWIQGVCELCSIPLILRASSSVCWTASRRLPLLKFIPKPSSATRAIGIVVGLRVGKLWRFRASDLIPRHLENDGKDLDEDAQAHYADMNHSCPQPDRR